MATAQQFRHEDVSAVPRGYKVRTVTHPSADGHRIRIAFPPGPRHKGSGKLVSILHPKRENPRTCSNQGIAALLLATPIEELLAAKALGSGSGNPKSKIQNPKSRTREQVGKMQENAVAFLRNVVKDSDKADEIEGMSVAEYAEKKKIALTNPKPKSSPRKRGTRVDSRLRGNDGRKRRKNQAQTGAAAALYEIFHGKKPKEIIELHQDVMRREDYAALGQLVEITLPDLNIALDFENDKVLLAASPNGKQMYVIGGNQDLRAVLGKVADDEKDFLDLGEVGAVVYRTRKDFDKFEEIDYKHKMGEGGHEKPRAMYDKLNKQIYFVGGEYDASRHEGIVH